MEPLTRKSLLTCTILLIAQLTSAAPTVGTMSGEVRTSDERIDIDRTIDALVRMRVNTYYYLIWQSPHDWDDLPAFAEAAARNNIEVWPYIVPWSETPPNKKNGWGYSEPFRNDYIRWAEEIGKLSLRYPNIPGYVIDDFYDNTEDEERFTPKYVRRMTTAGQRVNPKLKFFPLMYFQTPWIEFTNRFGELVDGVVICYPKSEAGIRNAVTYLHDRRHGPSAIIMLPRRHGAMKGDGAYVVCDVEIRDPDRAGLSFYYDVTDAVESDSSLQDARLRIDGRVVWQSPTEGRRRDAIVNVDLRRAMNGRGGKIRLQLDVITVKTGVPDKLPVIVRFDDIRVYGTRNGSIPFATELDLREKEAGKYKIDVLPGSPGREKFKFPIVLMPTGEPEQYQKRYDVRATPQAVAGKVRLCTELMRHGIVDGVVPYRTPLYPNDPYFEAIRREFDDFLRNPVASETE